MPVQLRPTRQVSISFDSRSDWWWVKSLKIWSHPFECWVYHTEIQQSQLVRQRTQRGNGDLEIFVLPQLPLWYASLLLLHHTYKSAAHQRTLVIEHQSVDIGLTIDDLFLNPKSLSRVGVGTKIHTNLIRRHPSANWNPL